MRTRDRQTTPLRTRRGRSCRDAQQSALGQCASDRLRKLAWRPPTEPGLGIVPKGNRILLSCRWNSSVWRTLDDEDAAPDAIQCYDRSGNPLTVHPVTDNERIMCSLPWAPRVCLKKPGSTHNRTNPILLFPRDEEMTGDLCAEPGSLQ